MKKKINKLLTDKGLQSLILLSLLVITYKQIAELQKKKEVAIKVSKKKAVVDVKKLILDFNLTKGDLRGKALKQLVGAEWVAKMKQNQRLKTVAKYVTFFNVTIELQ